MENYLTVRQVTRILKIHKGLVYKYIKEGKLKAYKLGGKDNPHHSWRISEDDLRAFIVGNYKARQGAEDINTEAKTKEAGQRC